HLLIWDPLPIYGLDFSSLAKLTSTLYVMVPADESRLMHFNAVRMARVSGAEKVIASTYLNDLVDEEDPVREAGRRGRWLAAAGADGIFVYWWGVGSERYEMIKKVFEEFKRVKELDSIHLRWLRGAKVVSVYIDPYSRPNIEEIVDEIYSQGASLIELDVGLSDYENLYGEGFSRALNLVKSFTSIAHSRGLSVVVYLPALEVISSERFPHEEWLQKSLDGRVLKVKGEKLDLPWLSPGETDLWLSPLSPHRDVIVARVGEIISKGGADGIWLDVPHMPSYLAEDMYDLWPDASQWGVASFRNSYYMDPPSSPDNSLEFRAWLKWRHEAVLDFIMEIADAVYEADGILMVESSACDHGGTELAYDPTLLRGNPLVIQVPEIGPPSWERGLYGASFEEWAGFHAMLKHARGSSSGSIVPLTYGFKPIDSSKQLGLILAIADGFFETNSENGLMTGTVGLEFRRKAFDIISMLPGEKNSSARIAVLFSRVTRDLVDRYVAGPYEVDGTVHMKAFRGVIKVLAENHIQFDVLPVEEISKGDLKRYDFIITPEIRCLTRESRVLLSEYAKKVLVIGQLGVLDDMGYPTPPLSVGMKVKLSDLPRFLANYSALRAPNGVIVEKFNLNECEILSIVNATSRRGEIELPRGSWILRFDDMNVSPADGKIGVPSTFLLVFLRGGNRSFRLTRGQVVFHPSIDKALDRDVIPKEGSSNVIVRIGGPAVDPPGWKNTDLSFIAENGHYNALRFRNLTFRSTYGVEDYAVIWKIQCGNLSLLRVAGITRYGTRAGLLWLVNHGVSEEYTIIRWLDDGDGEVELKEISKVIS
ncbi:MAG: hypothetical protein J7J65_05255, partial [Candidatus Korarchaeota archaeon]|nr:hypothetical protein [Candidatus Korarchaeota archaeon]